jgi:hypothetical protein
VFTVYRAQKMQEWLEREVEEWATGLVFEYFEDAEEISDLTEEQIIADTLRTNFTKIRIGKSQEQMTFSLLMKSICQKTSISIRMKLMT